MSRHLTRALAACAARIAHHWAHPAIAALIVTLVPLSALAQSTREQWLERRERTLHKLEQQQTLSGVAPPAEGPVRPEVAVALTLTSVNRFADAFGRMVVVGEVRNDTPDTLTFTRVNFVFLGAGNTLLGTEFAFVEGSENRRLSFGSYTSALPPGQTGFFRIFTTIPFASVVSDQFISDANLDATFAPFSSLSVSGPISLVPDGSGDVDASGVIANAGPVTAYLVEVNLAGYKNGQIEDVASTPVDGVAIQIPPAGPMTNTAIRPTDQAPFSTFFDREVTSVGRVALEWDEIGLMPETRTHSAAGGVDTFTVIRASGWSAVSAADWITVLAPTSSPSGLPATITYTVAANPASSPRVGTIIVSGLIFTVVQEGTVVTTTRTLFVTGSGNGNGAVASTAPASPSIACTVTGGGAGGTCAQSYTNGTMVTLSATPTSGSAFAGWSGACAGTGTCTVSMTQSRGVTATFTQETFTLSVSGGGNGSGGVNSQAPATPPIACNVANGAGTGTCTQPYLHDTFITLTAAASTGSVFTGWTGACSGTGTCTVLMTQARSVTATFTLLSHTLFVTAAGAGTGTAASVGVASPINCMATAGSVSGTCSQSYPHSTLVGLQATPAVGSLFDGWSGACSGTGTCVVAMTQVRSVTANFSLQLFPLTLSAAGNGSGLVSTQPVVFPPLACTMATGSSSGSCSGLFTYGSLILLTPAPAFGSTFTGWSGACTGAGPCVVSVTQARSVTATFALVPRLLSVTAAGNGSGSVASAAVSPAIACTAGNGVISGACSQSYLHGSAVALNATAAPGSLFAGWSGACTGTATCIVAMTQARAVTATFSLQVFPLTVSGGGNGSGSVTTQPGVSPALACTLTAGGTSGTCSGMFTFGSSITLTAAAATGSTFTGWSGPCTGTGTCVVSVTEARSVTAAFTLVPHSLTVTVSGNGSGSIASAAVNPAIACTAANGVVSGACSQSYLHGTAVALNATGATGSLFAGWSGACTGMGACVVSVTQARSVTATFVLVPRSLTVMAAGSGVGSVASAVVVPAIACTATSGVASGNCSQPYPHGTAVTLNATAPPGSLFSGWSGACSGSGQCTLTLNENSTVTATFILETRRLSLHGAGPGTGLVTSQAGLSPALECSIAQGVTSGSCMADYVLGAMVVLTAAPATGSLFTGWSEPGCGTALVCAVTISAARDVRATFDPIPATADDDGLPDDWESRFGLNPQLATGDSGPAGNPDGDGATNLQEYQRGTHPRGFFRRYFAEGATGLFFDDNIALLNTANGPATVLLHFQRARGGTVSHYVEMPALARRSVDPETLAGLGSAEFATVIESDERVIVDRTMTWNAGSASHAETSLAAPSTQWYLAEGATHSGFQLYYLIQNPGNTAANVHIEFLRPALGPVVRTYAVPPDSRYNIFVNDVDGLGPTDVSATITSDVAIIVERAMYKDRPGKLFAAGHESAGLTAPATEWFLAEGATGPFFDMFVLIANPNTQAADVTVRFLLPDGAVVERAYTIQPKSRFNIWVDEEGGALQDTAVSTTVTSTNGIGVLVERAMWWPGSPGTWTEAHNSAGVTAAGTVWGLAEGEQGGARSTETYILIANTSSFDGEARVTLYFEDGGTAQQTVPIKANSRTNVPVGASVGDGGFGPAAQNKRFGAIVESLVQTAPGAAASIVVERAMYSNAEGVVWAAGTNAVATRLQ